MAKLILKVCLRDSVKNISVKSLIYYEKKYIYFEKYFISSKL